MFKSLSIITIIYFLWFPIFLLMISGIGKLISYQLRRKLRTNNRNQPKKITLFSKIMRGVKTEFKNDNRPLSKKINLSRTITYWVITITGLLLSFIGFFTNNLFVIIGFSLSMIAYLYAYFISKGLLNDQENVKQRLYDSKKDAMGLVSNFRDGIDYDSEFKILEWAPDHIHFNKVLFYIPTSFDQLNTDAVIDKMNQNFGGGTAWVASPESETHGWNFVDGKVILSRTPELPHRADWDSHYVLNDNIAWSFFPIGLGVEHGVELLNPKTGKTEHVLGFDLQGAETKLGKKNGFYVGPEIVAAPQVLISGGTGGGKSLSENTSIPTVVSDEDDDKLK